MSTKNKQGIPSIIEQKSFHFETKSIDEEQGIIQGYLSTFDGIDQGGDRVLKGAFSKTLQEAKSRIQNKGKKFLWPLLWMHQVDQPIGGFTDAVEDAKGLLVTAQLDITTNEKGIPNNPVATMVFSGFKMGFIDELSIGYKALQKDYDKEGVRNLKEIQLWEGSAITLLQAMNLDAVITDVKMDTKTSDDLLPLAPRTTLWSKSKAIKDIKKAVNGDWSKASPYFLSACDEPTVESDYTLPIAANVGGEMKAVPQALIAAAGAIDGARGGVKDIDVNAVKAKITQYYDAMGMKPPWDTGEKVYMSPRRYKADSMDDMMSMSEQLEPLTGKDFDILFMQLMIQHHQAAIDMSNLAPGRADHPELATLATNIITAQTGEIAEMTGWLASWYKEKPLTPATNADMNDTNKHTRKKPVSMALPLARKDFNDRYRQEQIRDWKSTDFQNLVIALQSAIMDIFAIGDEPQLDVLDTILNSASEGSNDPGNKIGFIDALRDYVQKGIDLDVSSYISTNPYFSEVYGGYGYMARNDKLDTKEGRMVSQDNATRLKGHVDNLKQVKDMVASVADDMERYITGNPPYASTSGDANETTPNAGTELDTPSGKSTAGKPSAKALTPASAASSTDEDEMLNAAALWLTSLSVK